MIYKTDLFLSFTTLWRQAKYTLASTSHFHPLTTEHLSYEWPPSLPKPRREKLVCFIGRNLHTHPPSPLVLCSVCLGGWEKWNHTGNRIPRKAQKWFLEMACINYRGHQNPTFFIINFISHCLPLLCGIKLRSI